MTNRAIVVGKYYHRNFILTGLPRSGTTLLCDMIDQLENVVCLNESLYQTESLPGDFCAVRNLLMANRPIPCRIYWDNIVKDELGKSITTGGERRLVDKPIKPDVLIGSKVCSPYLVRLNYLIQNGWPLFAIVRHPSYTIGSWNRPQNKSLNVSRIPNDVQFSQFPFKHTEKYKCQCEVWQALTNKIIHYQKFFTAIVRYEDLTNDPNNIMGIIAKLLGADSKPDYEPLKNYNDKDRYPDFDKINEAVSELCPAMKHFGYEPI